MAHRPKGPSVPKKPAAERGPEATIIAQVEIAIPEWPAMSGVIGIPLGEPMPNIDQLSIQVHELVNDLRGAITKKKAEQDR
jgi:hypothetical protein